jgi:hypothetical protein
VGIFNKKTPLLIPKHPNLNLIGGATRALIQSASSERDRFFQNLKHSFKNKNEKYKNLLP